MEEVRSPWTSIVAHSAGPEHRVHVWGREYRFSSSPLPTGIVTAGEAILSSPIRFAGALAGAPIAWRDTGMTLLRQEDARVTLCGWLSAEHFLVNATVAVEFDGLVRVDAVLMAREEASPRPERLWLEVPLDRERARLFHYWPGRWGSGENSGAVPPHGLSLPFKPFLWLGWEEGGLGWFSESDEGWQAADGSRCLEVATDGRETLLRIHLFDSPPANLPRALSFGFQATPVKPPPRSFHELRICHGAQFGMEKTPYRQGESETILDRAARLGVKTLVFHEDWTPIEGYWETDREEELKSLVAACHARGIRLLLYFGYLLSSLAPEWGEVFQKVRQITVGELRWFPYRRAPDQWAHVVCLASGWQDRLVEGIARALDRYGVDGVYLDGTIEPFDCGNERHGCGYRSPDGRLHATHPIFAVRTFMKRVSALVHARGGIITAHQSTCCLTPTLSLCDSYWDGEQFMAGELAGDPLRALPLEAFRAEFMGKNFGVPAEFLVYARPPDWTTDHALAVTLLHDVRVRPWGFGDELERAARIWNAMTDFGVAESQWHPYWRNADSISARPDSVKASYYLRGASETRGSRVLLIVSNLSPREELQGLLDLKMGGRGSIGFTSAVDVLSGARYQPRANRLELPLKPMRAVLLLLE